MKEINHLFGVKDCINRISVMVISQSPDTLITQMSPHSRRPALGGSAQFVLERSNALPKCIHTVHLAQTKPNVLPFVRAVFSFSLSGHQSHPSPSSTHTSHQGSRQPSVAPPAAAAAARLLPPRRHGDA